MDEHKLHEQQYHDKRYTSHVREKADRNYLISGSIKEKYGHLLDGLGTDKDVLEIGCGLGGRLCTLAANGNRVTGIDLSEAALAQAKQNADAHSLRDVTLLCMDAEHLAFADNSFDAVYGTGILHHLDIDRMYQELSRVLRPGGRAIFIEPLGHNPAINLYRRMTPSCRTEHEHPLRMSDLRDARQYFSTVSVEYYYCATILALPFSRTPLFNMLIRVFDATDRALFTVFPFLRRYAWMALMQLHTHGTPASL